MVYKIVGRHQSSIILGTVEYCESTKSRNSGNSKGSEGLSSMELSQRCKVNATRLKVFSS